MELLTLKTYNTESEAWLVASFLEFHQVPCFINNNFISTVYPVFNSTIGGTELKIRREDLEKALVLLEEYERKNNDDDAAEDQNEHEGLNES
ncbi:hypothetical protein [Chryseobacterium sp. A301]